MAGRRPVSLLLRRVERLVQQPLPLLGLVAVGFVLRGLPFRDFVPIWDGVYYSDCVLAAVGQGRFSELNCLDHTTMAYLGLLALPQLLAYGNPAGFVLVNLVLGVAA